MNTENRKDKEGRKAGRQEGRGEYTDEDGKRGKQERSGR